MNLDSADREPGARYRRLFALHDTFSNATHYLSESAPAKEVALEQLTGVARFAVQMTLDQSVAEA